MSLRITRWLAAPRSGRTPRKDVRRDRLSSYRPTLEVLEDRLPPGSLLDFLGNLDSGLVFLDSGLVSLTEQQSASKPAASQQSSTSANSVSGEAYGVFVDLITLAGAHVEVPKTPDVVLPSNGGMASDFLLRVSVPDTLTATTLFVWTAGAVGGNSASAESIASVENVNILGGLITGQIVVAMSSSTSNGSAASSSPDGSTFIGLVVNGTAINVLPQANTTISLPGVGWVTLNEQIFSGDGVHTSALTVNMIHVHLNGALGTGDIIVSSAHSDVNFTLPTIEQGQPFLTGGGRIGDNGAIAIFGFNAGKLKNGKPTGELNFIDHTTGMHLKSTAITSFTATSATCVSFSGAATVDGQSGYTFTVNSCDNGEPGLGHDTFSITVKGPGLDYSSAAFGDVLTGGNVQLHRV